VWTGVSVIMLLAGIGWLVWYYAQKQSEIVADDVPDTDPLIGAHLSPSQRATVKYFFVVTLLFLLQIFMGILTAHYGVEGGGFYGIPLADYLPYVVTRTWHTQLGIFWIATAWLAAGLFIAPFICGYEPKGQLLKSEEVLSRPPGDVIDLLSSGALCSDATTQRQWNKAVSLALTGQATAHRH